MALPILTSNEYYNLEYSIIAENKILQVTGSVQDNTMTGTTALVREDVVEFYSDIDKKNITLPIGFENTGSVSANHWFSVHAVWQNAKGETVDTGWGKTEYLKVTKTFNVTSPKPITISNISVVLTGRGYMKQQKMEGSDDYITSGNLTYNNMMKNFPLKNTEKKFVLFNSKNKDYFNVEETNMLITEIDTLYPKRYITIMQDYALADPIIIDDNHYKYVIKCKLTPNNFCLIGGMNYYDNDKHIDTTEDEIVVDVQRLSDYTYTITADFIPKLNSVATSNDINPTKTIMSSIIYNVVDKFTININADTVNGATISYEYHLDIPGYEKYKTSISNNELITNMLSKGNIQWQQYLSKTLLDKFQDGKLWVKAKVKNSFMQKHNISINSKMQLKDVDNDFISHGGSTSTFLVKNIETIYDSVQCYNNIVLMEE